MHHLSWEQAHRARKDTARTAVLPAERRAVGSYLEDLYLGARPRRPREVREQGDAEGLWGALGGLCRAFAWALGRERSLGRVAGLFFGCLLAFSLFGEAHADPMPCPPVVILSGDANDAQNISKILLKRGVSTAEIYGCPKTHARVIQVEGHIVVELEDSVGRTSRRLVSSNETAATVIESWAYDALLSIDFAPFIPVALPPITPSDAPLDRAGPLPTRKMLQKPAPLFDASLLPELPEASAEDDGLSPLLWRGARFSFMSDFTVVGGALWYGGSVEASTELGPLQLGVMGRMTHKSVFIDIFERGNTPNKPPDCTAVDTDGDGFPELLDCDNGCTFLDADQDGDPDDRLCRDEAQGCSALDLNTDGTIDDFQCQPPSECEGLRCPPKGPPLESTKNSYQMMGSVGLPFQLQVMKVVPALSLGVDRFWSERGATSFLLHSELSVRASELLVGRVALDLRASLGITPGVLSSQGKTMLGFSVGLARVE